MLTSPREGVRASEVERSDRLVKFHGLMTGEGPEGSKLVKQYET